jgi:hypothetical protein
MRLFLPEFAVSQLPGDPHTGPEFPVIVPDARRATVNNSDIRDDAEAVRHGDRNVETDEEASARTFVVLVS